MTNTTLTKGMTVGSVAGAMGTLVMDLSAMGTFLALGSPASLAFSTCGDAAAAFSTWPGLPLAGGAPLGVLLHYLIGPAMGGLLGALMARFDTLRLDSAWKALGLGILVGLILSQPLLIAAAVVLQMTAAEAALWFGASFGLHLIYGAILGLALRYGLRGVPAA